MLPSNSTESFTCWISLSKFLRSISTSFLVL
jgi:hypothetical protein